MSAALFAWDTFFITVFGAVAVILTLYVVLEVIDYTIELCKRICKNMKQTYVIPMAVEVLNEHSDTVDYAVPVE